MRTVVINETLLIMETVVINYTLFMRTIVIIKLNSDHEDCGCKLDSDHDG